MTFSKLKLLVFTRDNLTDWYELRTQSPELEMNSFEVKDAKNENKI